MVQYISKARLAQAIRTLAAYGRQVDSHHGIQQLLPLLALKQMGADPSSEVQFEERDDFLFWDRYFLVDEQSQTGRYYDPFAGTRRIATHPHSNVATTRKATFANAWHAASYRIENGRTLWKLSEDYLRQVRERALVGGGQVQRIPTLDLVVWMWRHESFRDSATLLELQARFGSEFHLSPQEYSTVFEGLSTSPGTLSGSGRLFAGSTSIFSPEPVTPEDVLDLIVEVTGETVVPGGAGGPATAAFAPDLAALSAGLALQPNVVEQAATALSGGSHLIFAGPPGTGKSTLAENLAAAATRSYYVSGYKTATATADWTTFDAIGGYMPTGNGNELTFQEGVILRSIREDSWCIIDELNRANIDRAIGALLTLLGGSDQTAIVELPYRHTAGEGAERRSEPVRIRRDTDQPRSGQHRDSGDYVMGRNWRLLATMNTQDRSSLFPLTSAFARRFATIYVGIAPAEAALATLGVDGGPAEEVFRVLMSETDGEWINPRPLGPAVIKDAWQYVRHRRLLDGELHGAREREALAEALILYALPQYSGLEAAEWEPLGERLALALANGAPWGEQDAIAEAMERRLGGVLHGIHGEQ